MAFQHYYLQLYQFEIERVSLNNGFRPSLLETSLALWMWFLTLTPPPFWKTVWCPSYTGLARGWYFMGMIPGYDCSQDTLAEQMAQHPSLSLTTQRWKPCWLGKYWLIQWNTSSEWRWFCCIVGRWQCNSTPGLGACPRWLGLPFLTLSGFGSHWSSGWTTQSLSRT